LWGWGGRRDESYLHENHGIGYGYGTEAHGNGKGKRLILSHAITQHGLCTGVPVGREEDRVRGKHYWLPMRQPGPDGVPPGAIPLSAEWVWQANAKIKDYHDNMCGKTFISWFQEQLIPTLNAMYPRDQFPKIEGFVHVSDNAAYHWAAAAGKISVQTATKKMMQASGTAASTIDIIPNENIFITLGILSFVVTRSIRLTKTQREDREKADDDSDLPTEEHTFHYQDGGYWKRAPIGPTTDELKSVLYDAIVKQYPDKLLSELQSVCRKTVEDASADPSLRWHRLLFTVPYDAQSQPAELLWMLSKGRAGMMWFPGRNLKTALEHWLNGLYGGSLEKGLTREPFDRPVIETFKPADADQVVAFLRKVERHHDDFVLSQSKAPPAKTAVDFKGANTFAELRDALKREPAYSTTATIDVVLRCFQPRGKTQEELPDTGADEEGWFEPLDDS
jgi:hypothetical protein